MNDTEAPFSDRFIAGASYGGLSLIGLILNVALLIVLVKNRSTFSSSVFYAFVWQLMIGDMGILLPEVVVAMPLSLSGKALFGEGFLRFALSSFDTIGFCIVALTSLLLALNRLTIFISPRLNDILFTKPVVYVVFAIPWAYTVFWVLFTTLIGCPKTFSHEAYYFSYNCSSNITQLNDQIYNIFLVVHFFYPIVSLILYFVVYITLYLNRSKTENGSTAAQQRKRERSFLVQALIICCSLELEILGFTYMPKLAMAGFIDWYWVTLLIGWIIIINSSINPIIYVIFNQSIREAFVHLIHRSEERRASRTITVSTPRSSHPALPQVAPNGRRTTMAFLK